MNNLHYLKKAKTIGLASLLTAVLTVAACSSQPADNGKEPDPGTTTPTENPSDSTLLSEKPVTFKWFVPDRREAPVRNDWEIFEEIFNRTNVKVEFEPVPQDGVAEKKQILIATNSVTDFMTASHQDARLYGDEGVFLDLSEYLDEHAPNIKAFFEEYPQAKPLVTGVDGGIYSVPVLEGLGFNYSWNVREDLMQEYGVESPSNPDEFYEVLKLFKEKHPESYPLLIQGVSGKTGLFTVMLRAFTGIEGYLELNPESEQYEFAADHPGFQEAVTYMKKLYDEKLLDPEFAIVNGAQWEERMLTGKSFFTYHWKTRNQMFTDRAAESGLIPGFSMNAMPQFAADGINNYQYSRDILSANGMTISANVKDKVTAVKFLDYLLGKEGSDFLALGLEGTSYEYVDGEAKFLKLLGDAPYDTLRGKWGIWYPDINLNMDKSRKAEILSERAQGIEELYMPIVIPAPPQLVLTEEENAIRKHKADNLNVFLEEKITDFVVGRTPLNDDTLKQFMEQSEKLGAYELRDLYNTAYQRAKSAS